MVVITCSKGLGVLGVGAPCGTACENGFTADELDDNVGAEGVICENGLAMGCSADEATKRCDDDGFIKLIDELFDSGTKITFCLMN